MDDMDTQPPTSETNLSATAGEGDSGVGVGAQRVKDGTGSKIPS